LESIPKEDSLTSETVRLAHTIGCFQIESPGMRATLKEIKARNIDDILVALALYRPGPLTGGLKDAFVKRHLGLETPVQLHPALTPLLSDTYGVILYQEQVLRIAHQLAGLSLADSDLLRRAMSHFDPGKAMITLKEKFISGANNLSGVPADTASRIWELMAAFAGYGFPKAHAASYAVVSWRAAWCKTHYPEIFISAVLAGGGGYYRQRVYLNEARRMGLKLQPPNVNEARTSFSLSYTQGIPELFMGLNQVKELTRRTEQKILTERPFFSLADFLARVDPRPLEAENLARCGALSEFGRIPALIREIKRGWNRGQLPLFPELASDDDDYTLEERVQAQEEILGVGLDAHPLELVADRLGDHLSTVEAASQVGKQVRVAGIRQTWRRRIDHNGHFTYLMTIEDLEGTLDTWITEAVYRRARSVLHESGPYMIEGKVEIPAETEDPVLLVRRIDAI
jgi:DNA polymerase III alpha subunit